MTSCLGNRNYCQRCCRRRVCGDAGLCNECLVAAGLPKRPHGLKGRKSRGSFTPAELEETRKQMLAVSYDDIKAEFLKAVAESRAPKSRRKKAQAEE